MLKIFIDLILGIFGIKYVTIPKPTNLVTIIKSVFVRYEAY